MIFTDFQDIVHALLLSTVAGTPLLIAAFCCTPLAGAAIRFLPLAAIPALLTALTAPADVAVEIPWFFMGGSMGIDEIGRIFLLFASFIWLLASFSSRSMVEGDKGKEHFSVFFLTAMAGNFGLILARGMLGYYLFFAVMSLATYGLVVHKKTEKSLKAGQIYLTLVIIGEVALFTVLIIIVQNIGSLKIEDTSGASYHPLTLGLLFIGFGVKIGAIPLHGWMAPAYQATPIPAATVLAGAMVNAGILGWLRFLPLGQISCPEEAKLFIIAGALAAVYGVIKGLSYKQAGAVLGCSSISQMGLITVIFGLGLLSHDAGLYAAPVLILYVAHHSLVKSCLFFSYDLAQRQSSTLSHLQMFFILFPALALAGLPFTSGAIAKTAFKDLAVNLGDPWYSLGSFFLPVTAMGTALLMFHFLFVLKSTEGTDKPCKTESKTLFTVSLLTAAISLWLWPEAKSHAIHSLTARNIIHALWPITCGGLLYLVWRYIFAKKQIPAAEQDKQSGFDRSLNSATKFFQEKKWQQPQLGRIDCFLQKSVPQLRRWEKIMGRWKVVGLTYLTLCLCLLLMLL